ncbi:MAG: cytochrome c3 family protein [Sutterella wadsworthensis]|jgi:fumarate reductase flavoprotein subunit|nr:cytochrome c3 family protein [Sutterella wadsworthensis]
MKMTTLILASLCAATFAFGTAQAADQKFGADRHVGIGLSCETCHGPDKANPQEPTIDTCKQCHDVKALVEKTKDVKPANPHMSPHYRDELECTNCHIMHGETENFCDQCHQFGYKVP